MPWFSTLRTGRSSGFIHFTKCELILNIYLQYIFCITSSIFSTIEHIRKFAFCPPKKIIEQQEENMQKFQSNIVYSVIAFALVTSGCGGNSPSSEMPGYIDQEPSLGAAEPDLDNQSPDLTAFESEADGSHLAVHEAIGSTLGEIDTADEENSYSATNTNLVEEFDTTVGPNYDLDTGTATDPLFNNYFASDVELLIEKNETQFSGRFLKLNWIEKSAIKTVESESRLTLDLIICDDNMVPRYRNLFFLSQLCSVDGNCALGIPVDEILTESTNGFHLEFNVHDGDVQIAKIRQSLEIVPAEVVEIPDSSPAAEEPVLQSAEQQPESKLDEPVEQTLEPETETSNQILLSEFGNIYYVATNGSTGATGTSIDSPLSSIQTAINKAEPGDAVFVRAGKYAAQQIAFPKPGTDSLPISLIGYNKVPGDVNEHYMSDYNAVLTGSKVPLLDGGSRASNLVAINIRVPNIVIKNFEITNYKSGIYGQSAHNSRIENVVLKNLGNPQEHYDGYGITINNTNNAVVNNNVVINATAQAMTTAGDHNTLTNNKVFAYDNSNGIDSATDYYFVLLGANHNTIRNNYIERVGDLGHNGHGFTVKGKNQYNIFENNIAVNLKGGGFVARWHESTNNTFRGGSIIGGNGILVTEGANNNLFENIEIRDVSYGIWSYNSGENKSWSGHVSSSNNNFRNIKISKAVGAISFRAYGSRHQSFENNIFENLAIKDSTYVFIAHHSTSGNTLVNSAIENVSKWGWGNNDSFINNLGFSFTNIDLTNTGFTIQQ